MVVEFSVTPPHGKYFLNFLKPSYLVIRVQRCAHSSLAVLLLALSCAASGRTKADRFDAVISTYGKAGFINVVLIGEHGRIIYARGVGGADFGAHVANTPQTKFGIDHQTTAGIVLVGRRISQNPV